MSIQEQIEKQKKIEVAQKDLAEVIEQEKMLKDSFYTLLRKSTTDMDKFIETKFIDQIEDTEMTIEQKQGVVKAQLGNLIYVIDFRLGLKGAERTNGITTFSFLFKYEHTVNIPLETVSFDLLGQNDEIQIMNSKKRIYQTRIEQWKEALNNLKKEKLKILYKIEEKNKFPTLQYSDGIILKEINVDALVKLLIG